MGGASTLVSGLRLERAGAAVTTVASSVHCFDSEDPCGTVGGSRLSSLRQVPDTGRQRSLVTHTSLGTGGARPPGWSRTRVSFPWDRGLFFVLMIYSLFRVFCHQRVAKINRI